MNIFIKKLKSKRGSMYIEAAVILLVCIALLVMLIAFIPVYMEGREVGRIADELAQRIAWTGKADANSVSSELSIVARGSGYTATVYDQNNNILNRQLNIEEFFKVTVSKNVGVNVIAPTQINVSGRATGRAYVYSKS